MTNTVTPRTWLDHRSVRDHVRHDGGLIVIQATRADHVHLDAGWADGGRESDAIPVDQITARFTGHAYRIDGDTWAVDPSQCSFTFLGGGDTPRRRAAVVATVDEIVRAWAAESVATLAEAERIARNNGAHTLERKIAEHADALKILRRELRRCESGKPYATYPKLPTAR